MKKLVMLGLSLLMAVSMSGCGSDSNDSKKLTILTNSGYKPYEMVNKKGELYGFDIDVAEKAAKIAGYELKWEDMDFDGIIDSLKTGKGDLAIAGITPTADRAKSVDFSEIYYDTAEDTKNMVLSLKDGTVNETADIKGKKTGVQMGTAQESTSKEIQKEYDLSIDARKSYSDLVQELKNKNIDFMIVESVVAKELSADNADLKYFPLGVGTDPIGNAMCFKKGSKIKADFDKAIIKMKEDGSLDKLIKKYFE